MSGSIRKYVTAKIGVWPPTGIAKVWNLGDEPTVVVASRESPGARTNASVGKRTAAKTLLIAEEPGKGDGHAEHGHTTAAPGEDALPHVRCIVCDGIVDDESPHDAHDTGEDEGDGLHVGRVAVGSIPGIRDAVGDGIRIHGTPQECHCDERKVFLHSRM